jgi:hypothetical protein
MKKDMNYRNTGEIIDIHCHTAGIRAGGHLCSLLINKEKIGSYYEHV